MVAPTPVHCRSMARAVRAGGIARRGETGVYIGPQLGRFLGKHLSRRAEIDQHGRAVVADVDIGRLDVQVQQLVGVHFHAAR